MSPVRRIGADTCWPQLGWSFGRADLTGCTTGSAIRALGPAGKWRDWRHELRQPVCPSAGRPMKVFYVEEEEELDSNEKLARTIEQLNKNLEKNLKV